MQSFRSEIENPIVEKDIIELEQKIAAFRQGKIDEERFRSLRLARGVYGQRQAGVQMVRIKIPFGKLNSRQLLRICDVSEKYSRGRLHITTRQDIQIHHVNLDRTPELWSELERDDITLREACGNTVRNVTASETAGIDPNEPFDVRPYADAVFKYFLRNPICQEMGRKFKIAFSNTASDTGLAYMHDIGFVAATKNNGDQIIEGFKVFVGGGLGSQSHHAELYESFIPGNRIIALTEAVLRVFERHGERSRRMKARLKFLVKDWGLDKFKEHVNRELESLDFRYEVDKESTEVNLPLVASELEGKKVTDDNYRIWLRSNTILQKDNLYSIGVKVRLGDLYTDQARKLVRWAKELSGDEFTLTINQNLLIRHIKKEWLPEWYERLKSISLHETGFNKLTDVTACPGTDTCNLGIASSTGLALVLEEIIEKEYPQLAGDDTINIKISGCMNSCGQHMIASIGFQGMSMRAPDKRVLPAAQILLGGATLGNGTGRFADKVIKIPSKRTPEALRIILDDYEKNSGGLSFIQYYDKREKNYFYDLLKPLSDIEEITDEEFIDWGHSAPYVKAIGVGECAGVVIDLISTLFFESEEKLELARRTIDSGQFKDSIYHSYSAFINTAKALLTADEKKTNTHAGIIENFQAAFVETERISLDDSFSELVLQLKTKDASKEFARTYFDRAESFYKMADRYRLEEFQK